VLHTAALLYERAGPEGWWKEGRTALARMAGYLVNLCAQAEKTHDLIPGIPEADVSGADPNNISDSTHNEGNRYFHNNAWIARGLVRWAELSDGIEDPGRQTFHARFFGRTLTERTLSLIEQTWPREPDEWWLSPQVEPCPVPGTLTAAICASYTNYRYWPELLSSGILPARMATRLVQSRLTAGGQFCGMTRFEKRLDDWPLADYLYGLWALGRKEDFLLSLYGHVAFHQAAGHMTAYEQVTFPPGKELAPYCLPSQLVAVRAAHLLVDPRE
jgi:hypothetical protein